MSAISESCPDCQGFLEYVSPVKTPNIWAWALLVIGIFGTPVFGLGLILIASALYLGFTIKSGDCYVCTSCGSKFRLLRDEEKEEYLKTVPDWEAIKASKRVPEWNTYYPDISFATKLQRSFYDYWLGNLEKELYIDVEGNLSYLFVYLYGVVGEFVNDGNIIRLSTAFRNIKEGYSDYENLMDYLIGWEIDANLYAKRFDKAWALGNQYRRVGKGPRLTVEDIYNFRSKCEDTSIDGFDLLHMLVSESGLTDFGKTRREEIAELATGVLGDFQSIYGTNFIEGFYARFDFADINERDFTYLGGFFKSNKEYLYWRSVYETGERNKYPYEYGHTLFSGIPIEQPSIKCYAVPSIIKVAALNQGKEIIRECENSIRGRYEIPRVGEGWVNETILFYKIKEAFPKYNIIRHGKPDWLSPQHLDIHFQDLNVAIEYQGKQHFEPVEYFGGEEAFKEQQLRDERKKRLCEEIGCILIYVTEGYDFDKLVNNLSNVFQDMLN